MNNSLFLKEMTDTRFDKLTDYSVEAVELKSAAKPTQKKAINTAKKTKPDAHTHPSLEAYSSIKRPSTAGSLGEINDEGCFDLADLDYSVDENVYSTDELFDEVQDLSHLIIYSEIMGKPKCRR